jgi:hypothetical protein
VTDAIRRSGTIDWIRIRHEEAAVFAAGADAELTGQLAVCAGSCGPAPFAIQTRREGDDVVLVAELSLSDAEALTVVALGEEAGDGIAAVHCTRRVPES